MSAQKNNPRVLNSWAAYDMANSVYSLCIATAIFPPYFEGLTSAKEEATGKIINDTVSFFGIELTNTVLYTYALSTAFLVIALLSPILSGIADSTGNKKSFMKFFVYLGALSCAGLFFFEPMDPKIFPIQVELPIIAFILATIGFSGSIVFYNSYLPEIATPDRFEKISARGYAMGYGGSVLLLVLNLMMIQKPHWFGLANGAEAARWAFLTVGIWWASVAQITFFNLPPNEKKQKTGISIFTKGFKELGKVFRELQTLPKLKTYLTAFFFISMGLQTVMFVASIFGKKVLNLETSDLIMTVMIIQIIAIPGAYFFAWMAKKRGNINTLIVANFIWIGICVGAFYTYTNVQFYILAAVVGWVMGGVQALCRATVTRLLPREKDISSYFSFYDATEKFAIVFGTMIYGTIEEITGDMRNSVLSLMVFFILAGLALWRITKVKQEKMISINQVEEEIPV